MSAKYFQQFLEQLDATGKMKADGYDLSIFKKMNNSDLRKAEVLLLRSLHKGDWNSIDALCIMDSERAIQELEKVFPDIAANRFLKFKLASYLYSKTGLDKYKMHISPKIGEYNENDRLSTVMAIPGLSNAITYVDTLFDLAVNDNYSVVRFYSGVALLRILNLIKNEEDIEAYRPILRQLASSEKKERFDGTREIKELF